MAPVATPDAAPAYTPTAPNTTQHIAQADQYIHNDHDPSDLPPAYPTSLPDKFRIGMVMTPPLVSVSELQAHLRLLGAFATLRKSVEATAESKENGDAAWAVFLARAVYRFHRWVIRVRPETDGTLKHEAMPPIDVLMVWHSYCLVSLPVLQPPAMRSRH